MAKAKKQPKIKRDLIAQEDQVDDWDSIEIEVSQKEVKESSKSISVESMPGKWRKRLKKGL